MFLVDSITKVFAFTLSLLNSIKYAVGKFPEIRDVMHP